MTWSRPELEQQWTPMVRAARAVLGSQDEAEECAALALVQVLERQPQADNLQAFMVTVARRRALDRLRDIERGRARDLKLVAWAERQVTDVADDIVTRAEARWVDQVARRELRPEVYQLLRHIADGQPIAEVAAALGMTDSAAASHLRRARVLLRGALAKTLGVLALGGAWRRRSLAGVATAGMTATALMITTPFTGGPGGQGTPPGAGAPALEVRHLQAGPQRHTPVIGEAAVLGTGPAARVSGRSGGTPPRRGSS